MPAAFARAAATPLSITCPAPLTVEATANASAPVTPLAATTTGDGVTVAGPVSGSYPLGTTTVTYTATDSSGNHVSCNAQIIVVDTTPPTIVCPAPITVEATANASAFVTPAAATASDTVTGVTVTGPAAGSYPLGSTTVTYTATDSSNNIATCTSQINVVDTTPPTIVCPAPISVDGAGGVSVTYFATATDATSVTLSYSRPSGSSFPVGTTTVVATATDSSGHSSSCSFTVTVNQLLPTATSECKKGGWEIYGIFKNQGDCVSFVATHKSH